MDAAEVLIAVDPSLRGTGFAVLERSGGKVRCLHFDVVKNPPKLSQAGCLLEIHTRLGDAIKQFRPTAMAVESVIFVQSFPTAMIRTCLLPSAETSIYRQNHSLATGPTPHSSEDTTERQQLTRSHQFLTVRS